MWNVLGAGVVGEVVMVVDVYAYEGGDDFLGDM